MATEISKSEKEDLKDAILSLLAILRSGHLSSYRTFFRETVELLRDLQSVLEYFQRSGVDANATEGKGSILIHCYRTFGLSPSASKDFIDVARADSVSDTGSLLDVSSLNHCVHAIENLTILLTVEIQNFPQVVADSCINLWPILFEQIARGNLPVKEAAVNAIQIAIQRISFPTCYQDQLFQYFLLLMQPCHASLRSKDLEQQMAVCLVYLLSGTLGLGTLQLYSGMLIKDLRMLFCPSDNLSPPLQVREQDASPLKFISVINHCRLGSVHWGMPCI